MTAVGALSLADWDTWSVIYLKPDCLQRHLTGEILDWIGEHVQVSAVTPVTVTSEQIHAHYADLIVRQQEFSFDVAAQLDRIHAGQQAVIALGHGPGAPARLRALIGPTDPARAGPGTIRGRYGIDTLARGQAERRLISNLIHTSDHQAAARRDFLIWYGASRSHLITGTRPADPQPITKEPR